MRSTIDILDSRVVEAMRVATCAEDCKALVKQSGDAKFGDYQANGVMALAKQVKTNPRQLAEQVVEKLDVSDMCEVPEIAGPGFINLRLKKEYLSEKLLEIKADQDRLAIEKTETPKTVVVDYSAPNIAKQMHVGHLRSTIIGDCISRVMEFEGNNVIRQNHIGDWGTQFGMLIAYLKKENPNVIDNPASVEIADLEQFYQSAKAACDADAEFEAEARKEVVKLHNKDEDTIKVWKHIVDESRKHYQPIYGVLGVTLEQEDERGESFYADKLGDVVEDLKSKGVAVESDKAICVFPDKEKFKNKEGDPLPFIVQKSDGAFLYATTDCAALKYRVSELGADKIIYVTDARQALHFQMLFATVQLAGWIKDGTELMHVTFGTMLGEDNKPFKTRTGGTVKLKDLLEEAVERAKEVVKAKNPEFSEEQVNEIAKAVGIGAVKYADYSNNRNSDYVFSFGKMLAMDGNTAPYMQYAYARVKSIERKAEEKGIDIVSDLANIQTVDLEEAAECDLALHLIRYGEAIGTAAADCRPNYLTSYLYDLGQKFSSFYNNCPVLGADENQRPTRVLLCELTARTMKHGLCELLGIEVVDQM